MVFITVEIERGGKVSALEKVMCSVPLFTQFFKVTHGYKCAGLQGLYLQGRAFDEDFALY